MLIAEAEQPSGGVTGRMCDVEVEPVELSSICPACHESAMPTRPAEAPPSPTSYSYSKVQTRLFYTQMTDNQTDRERDKLTDRPGRIGRQKANANSQCNVGRVFSVLTKNNNNKLFVYTCCGSGTQQGGKCRCLVAEVVRTANVVGKRQRKARGTSLVALARLL